MSSATALGLVLFIWAMMAPALAGAGLLVARAFALAPDPFDAFWLGVAAVLIGLQWWILLFPITGFTLAAFAATAVIGWVVEGESALRRWGRPDSKSVALVVTLLAIGVWLAARSLGPPHNDDSGVYHVGAVLWAGASKAVPGIGNLHPFLAVNHGFFLYAALMNAVPFSPGFQHVANGLLALGFVGLALRGALETAWRPGLARPSALAAASLLPWAVICAQSSDVANASSDLCELALGAAFVVWWAKAFEVDGAARTRALRGGVLLVAALTVVKLSAAGAVAGVMLAVLVASSGRRLRALAEAVGVGLVAAVPLSAGTVVRSGYWPYPGALVALPVDWRMPRSMVVAVDRWTLAWGRGTTARWEAPPDWSWLPSKLEELATQYQALVLPVVAAVVLLALALVLGGRARAGLTWAQVLPALGGILLWLFTSPSLRYAGIWAQAIAALAAAAALANAGSRLHRGLAMAVWLWSGARAVDLAHELDLSLRAPMLALPTPSGAWRENEHGTRAFVPSGGDHCWGLPLPCTTHLDPALELRERGRPEAGFRLSVDLETYRPATLRILAADSAAESTPAKDTSESMGQGAASPKEEQAGGPK